MNNKILMLLLMLNTSLDGMCDNIAINTYEMAENISYVMQESKQGLTPIMIRLNCLCMYNSYRNIQNAYIQYGTVSPIRCIESFRYFTYHLPDEKLTSSLLKHNIISKEGGMEEEKAAALTGVFSSPQLMQYLMEVDMEQRHRERPDILG